MNQLYVIGNPIEHSLSPVMHNAALKTINLDTEFRYDVLQLPKKHLPDFVDKIRNHSIQGASVTIPYKEAILQYVDICTDEAHQAQAANTVYAQDDKIVAHNTDGIGCIRYLQESGVNLSGKRVILLGAGGAAKAIAVSLLQNKIKKLNVLNRSEERAEQVVYRLKKKFSQPIEANDIRNIADYIENVDIIINATPVGMKGAFEHESLIPFSLLHSHLLILDIVYNPRKTKLLQDAQEKGARGLNGIGMLVYQGAEQFKIFTGKKAPVSVMKQAVMEVLY